MADVWITSGANHRGRDEGVDALMVEQLPFLWKVWLLTVAM